MTKPYYKGFWDWCKENHPEIVLKFYKEMQQGVEALEKFVNELEAGE